MQIYLLKEADNLKGSCKNLYSDLKIYKDQQLKKNYKLPSLKRDFLRRTEDANNMKSQDDIIQAKKNVSVCLYQEVIRNKMIKLGLLK